MVRSGKHLPPGAEPCGLRRPSRPYLCRVRNRGGAGRPLRVRLGAASGSAISSLEASTAAGSGSPAERGPGGLEPGLDGPRGKSRLTRLGSRQPPFQDPGICLPEGLLRSRYRFPSSQSSSGRLPLQPITERFPSSQSPLEDLPPSPEEAVVPGNHDVRFSLRRRETAMSKGRAEAGAGVPGVLLRYLQEQNRPYSAQDVFGNLQREHGLGKAAVVKALEHLAQQGKIREKTYGKQKVYFADQDQFDTVSDADLQSMDAKIVALTAKVQGLQQSCRHMEAELKELTSALTTPEMQREVEQLKAECAGYTERLRGIRAAPAGVTPAEKEQVHREQQRYCREWRMRKRLAMELSAAILEGYPKSKKQFFEEVGIETDEDHHVVPPEP